MTPTPWTDHALDLLKLRMAKGASYSAIAAEIGNGVTRSAVAGKSRRLGLVHNSGDKVRREAAEAKRAALEAKRQSEALLQAAREAAPRIVKMTAPRPDTPPEAFPHGGITFAKLNPRSCRWSSGDPKTPEFRFCGAMADSGSWCCALHRKMAYVAGSSRAGYSHRAGGVQK